MPRHLSLCLALSFPHRPLAPMSPFPRTPYMVDSLSTPNTPPYVMPAESLFLFCEQDCLANGAHLCKQPQCHQWTLVTVGQSPRFGRLAARDLVPRQNLSPSLKRAAWVGRGGVLGSPESDLPVLKEGRKESGGEPEKVVLTEATPSSSGLRPGPSSSRKLHWPPSSLPGTSALTLII